MFKFIFWGIYYTKKVRKENNSVSKIFVIILTKSGIIEIM